MIQVDPAGVDGVEQILAPRHQQPDDGTLLLGDRPENPLGLHAPQEHRLAAGDEAAEPVHLGAGVVEGRDQQEHVLAGLMVVVLLGLAGAEQRPMVMENGLGEARGAGGEVNGRVIVLGECHRRRAGGAVSHQLAAVLGVGRDVPPHEEERLDLGKAGDDGIHPGDEPAPKTKTSTSASPRQYSISSLE